MYIIARRCERGQSLAVTAMLMLAFIALLALVLDGGQAYFQRRNAQNAADAGALAGARVYCESRDVAQGEAAATTYVTSNGAQLYEPVTIDTVTRTVTVRTQITFTTFFARVLGSEEVTAVASATAGCYSPTTGEGVLPTVWNCRPPVPGWGSNSGDCQQQRITWPVLQDYINPIDDPDEDCQMTPYGQVCRQLYIVMDSESYDNDFECFEETGIPGTLICDLDGDGEPDWLAGGGRSWVDLDGAQAPDNCPPPTSGEGSDELREWITNGFACDLNAHTWIPEQTGVSNNIFLAVEARRRTSPIVVLPVFNAFCENDPRNLISGCDWHGGEDLIREFQPTYFHIIGFSAFYITCVRNNPSDHCPGIERARQLNPIIRNSVKSIEGYFLEGYIPGLRGRGRYPIDTGVFTVYLDE